jgi:SAM-dependent methyltransferase
VTPADSPDAASRRPLDPTRRFSSRVDDYVKYRPGYPAGVIDVLVRHAQLSPASVVADVGAGTGISSAPLLAYGCTVVAVEPNAEMRAAAEGELGTRHATTFRAVDGRAEATTLPPRTIDLVVCAQAFHWFDRAAAAEEFTRILRPGGRVAVIWNERQRSASPFLTGYEELLTRHGTDYHEIAHQRRPIDVEELASLFGGRAERHVLPNAQTLDWAGLRGRVMSASYVPLPGEAGHDELMTGLRGLYDRCQDAGLVRIEYETEIFVVTLPVGR